jgi:group I intron endonuclease
MKRIKNPAIYKIENNKDNKIYIGSAIDYKDRWANHKSRLIKGNHHNNHLQNAFNKYGINAFKFSLLEKIDVKNKNINGIKSLLIEREQHYLDNILFANQDNNLFYIIGYNKRRIAENNLGIKVSNEGRLNISRGHIGIKPSIETKIKMSKSIRIAKSKSTYTHSKETRDKISKSNKGRKLTNNHRMLISKNSAKNKKCNQYTKDGTFIKEWKSLTLAANKLGIIQQHISAVCRNRRTFAGNYKWKYA